MTTSDRITATPVTAPAPPPRPAPAWPRYTLLGILVVCFTLYTWAIGANGFWGNQYYAAAVKAMSGDPLHFLFGAYDQAGVVAIDKPPLALWPQVVFTWIFGYHPWVLLLPQAIEGVLTVFLLHRTVRLWAGEHAALLAAAVLTLTPVTVAINRDNNPDTLFMLFLVAAAYALTRALHADTPSAASRTRWLLLAGFFIGCGFNTKMMQAWVVLPAFALAYLVGAHASRRRRIGDLAAAGAVTLVSSLWWVVLFWAWPGPKPFAGGSPTGSPWTLVLGYNGFGRVLGNNNTTGSEGQSKELLTGLLGELFGGATGPFRLFAPILGGQISWLLPAVLLVLVAVAVTRFAGTAGRSWRAGWVLWGTWLLVGGLVLSFSKGMFHPYYTTQLAPAVAALFATGLVLAWRWFHEEGPRRWLLPSMVAVTVFWAYVLVARDVTWNGWLRFAVLPIGVAAVAGLVFVGTRRRVVARASLVLGTVASLLAPTVWSFATGFGPSHSFLGAGNVAAGPYVLPPYFEQFGPESAAQASAALSRLTGNGFSNVTLNDTQTKVVAYVSEHASDVPIQLAVEGGAVWGSRYAVSSDLTVVAFGGYAAGDNVPTVDQLEQWVRDGRMRFVLSSSLEVDGIPYPTPFAGGPAPTGDAAKAANLIFAPLGGVPEETRIRWVHENCVRIPPAEYGVTDPEAVAATEAGFSTLYDCQARS